MLDGRRGRPGGGGTGGSPRPGSRPPAARRATRCSPRDRRGSRFVIAVARAVDAIVDLSSRICRDSRRPTAWASPPSFPHHATSTPSSSATSSASSAPWPSTSSGEISEDVFRVMRLNNGIYGQRQGGTNQMVRIKLPAGTITPEQLDLIGHLAETYSRGWGHITTRQNMQIHYVELTKVPDVMRAPRRRRAHHPRGLRRHGAQRDGLSPGRRLPARVPRRHRRGPRPRSSTSCATRSASACRASSRSTSPAARPTAARRCSTTSA